MLSSSASTRCCYDQLTATGNKLLCESLGDGPVGGAQECLLPLGQAENRSWFILQRFRFYHVSEDDIFCSEPFREKLTCYKIQAEVHEPPKKLKSRWKVPFSLVVSLWKMTEDLTGDITLRKDVTVFHCY